VVLDRLPLQAPAWLLLLALLLLLLLLSARFVADVCSAAAASSTICCRSAFSLMSTCDTQNSSRHPAHAQHPQLSTAQAATLFNG
jgi:hypothetical protein